MKCPDCGNTWFVFCKGCYEKICNKCGRVVEEDEEE